MYTYIYIKRNINISFDLHDPPRSRWVVCRSDMHAIYLGGPIEGQQKVHLLATDRHDFVGVQCLVGFFAHGIHV